MIEKVTNIDEYESFISAHPKGHFLQSYAWGKVKKEWRWDALVSRDESGKIRGSISLLTRKIPHTPYSIMYSGRGPVCDSHDKETLKDLMDGAKKFAKERKAYVLKMDPDILSSDTEFAEIMKSLGMDLKEGGKNFDGVQPRYVFRLDIAGKTEEQLMSEFHHKTRYNIRLAERKGVEVKIEGKNATADFTEIMKTTGTRDGFITRPQSYFETILDELGENARLYMAYLDGKAIAGTLAVYYGDKVWYVYGASANESRNVMPNYLLQWHMIKWALEKNCRIYDFRGVSGDLSEDNPLYGLYKFKKGFSGDLCEFVGEFEYKANPLLYTLIEKGTDLYRYFRRKLYLLKK